MVGMRKLSRIGGRFGPLLAKSELLVPVWRHPATPAKFRVVLVLIILYLFLPKDLISDMLPLVGMLDDGAVMLAGLALAMRWVPEDVLAQASRDKAMRRRSIRRLLWWVLAGVIVWGMVVWLVATLLILAL